MKKLLLFVLLAGLSLVAPGLTTLTATAAAPLWTPVGPTGVGPWLYVASSADGKKLIAATETAHYTSKDSGKTWVLGPSASDPDSGVLFLYSGVASSADGTRLLIIGTALFGDSVSIGNVHTSMDSGATFANVLALGDGSFFSACASSADGSRLVVSGGGPSAVDNSVSLGIWTSANGGVDWSFQPGSPPPVDALASSADGSKLIGTRTGSRDTDPWDLGDLWISKDSGKTWKRVDDNSDPGSYGGDVSGVVFYRGATSSADGNTLMVLGSEPGESRNGVISLSKDGGQSWSRVFGFHGLPAGGGLREGLFDACASSADGSRLFAAGWYTEFAGSGGSGIFASLDSGATWTLQPGSPDGITALASSADGKKLIGAGRERLYVYDATAVSALRLTCPPDVRVECGRGPLPDKTGGLAKASGGCAPVRISYSDSSANGPRPIVKVITRTWTAKDSCGNTATCQQKITIVDTVGPVIHRLMATPGTVSPANNKFVTVKLDAVVEDACSTLAQVAPNTTLSVKVTDPAGSDGKSYYAIKSVKEVQLRAKKGVSYAITLNVADFFGNKTSKTVTVAVK